MKKTSPGEHLKAGRLSRTLWPGIYRIVPSFLRREDTMEIRRLTMVELKSAVYKHEGWQRQPDESMSARILQRWDISVDINNHQFVAKRKSDD